MPPLKKRIQQAITAFFQTSVTAVVNDDPGWRSWTSAPNERDGADAFKLYQDALEAWRLNPIGRRIINLTTDFALGDGITITAPGNMGQWIRTFWTHARNNMPAQLPELSDELSRAGDLFLTFHTNPTDGMSYLRPIPKNRITQIISAANDWTNELIYVETTENPGETREWFSPTHPDADTKPAIMLHIAVNRPVGALLGESDLAPILPWLRRYSRMLEGRVRLNEAVRSFLWHVKVPTNLVESKAAKYATPPEPGSVIVSDDNETWTPITPLLRANDANYDLRALRRMLQAGTYPPHWLNDPEDINRATAQAMNDPAFRQLRRRQLVIIAMCEEIAHIAYSRAHKTGHTRGPKPNREAIKAHATDLNREDNGRLASAANSIASALATLTQMDPQNPLYPLAARTIFDFAGRPIDDETNAAIAAKSRTNE